MGEEVKKFISQELKGDKNKAVASYLFNGICDSSQSKTVRDFLTTTFLELVPSVRREEIRNKLNVCQVPLNLSASVHNTNHSNETSNTRSDSGKHVDARSDGANGT